MTQYNSTQIVLLQCSSTGGFGKFFQDKWAFGRWSRLWPDLGRLSDKTFLELFPVMVAISVWGPLLANKRILFHIDNQAVVRIINKISSKSPQVMALVRRLVLDTLNFHIIFRAEYINTKIKAVADSISLCQWRHFRFPQADTYTEPTPLPLTFGWFDCWD